LNVSDVLTTFLDENSRRNANDSWFPIGKFVSVFSVFYCYLLYLDRDVPRHLRCSIRSNSVSGFSCNVDAVAVESAFQNCHPDISVDVWQS